MMAGCHHSVDYTCVSGHTRSLTILHSVFLLCQCGLLGHICLSLPSPTGRFYSIFKALLMAAPLEPFSKAPGKSNHDPDPDPISYLPSPFLTLLQPHRLPCSFLNLPSQHQPQGLCTSYSLCLKCTSPRYPHAHPFISIIPLLKCLLHEVYTLTALLNTPTIPDSCLYMSESPALISNLWTGSIYSFCIPSTLHSISYH